MRIKRIIQFLTLIALAAVLYDYGFNQTKEAQRVIEYIYFSVTLAFALLETYRLLNHDIPFNLFYAIRIFLPLSTTVVIMVDWIIGTPLTNAILEHEGMFLANVLLLVLYGLTAITNVLYRKSFSPALIFTGSFMVVIVMGVLLLKLPNATTHGISFINALFTITSAVSVTGLSVVDTQTAFTTFGKTVILICIQLGGLGMLTLTAFFAFFFKGKSSYVEGLFIRDFLSSEKFGGLFELALKIVLLSLFVEACGAVFMYFYLPQTHFPTFFDRAFFSIFHAISAFCNAGFSTLSNNLYQEEVRFAYPIHLMVCVLIIFGGLGFSITLNLLTLIKNTIWGFYEHYFLHLPKFEHSTRIATLNTRIVIHTTAILLVVGTVLFWAFEHNGVMKDHPTLLGKFTVAFLGSVTPRTAGFNNVDMAALSAPTIFMTILLMWIGASPASTGGGIKTSTFALAVLNIVSIVRNKPRVEAAGREVPQDSVNRAFAIIVLSVAVFCTAFAIMAYAEPKLSHTAVFFECVSAYSTVGLSLGITMGLSDFSKILLIIVMFVGRVGAITILIGLVKDVECSHYRLPKESVLIN